MKKSVKTLDKHIGLRIKMRRILSDVTLEDLSKKLGISFQQIQKYEKGTNRISASRLYDISQALNVDISYFFEGFDDKMIIEETIEINLVI
jgi:transcriptional regulator with XRE-family HTH domain